MAELPDKVDLANVRVGDMTVEDRRWVLMAEKLFNGERYGTTFRITTETFDITDDREHLLNTVTGLQITGSRMVGEQEYTYRITMRPKDFEHIIDAEQWAANLKLGIADSITQAIRWTGDEQR